MLGTDIFVLQLASFGLGRIQRLFEMRAEKQVGGTDALNFMPAGKLMFQVRLQLGRGHADLLKQIRDEAVGLANHGQQQMLPIHFLMRMLPRDALRFLHRLLRLNGESVHLHMDTNKGKPAKSQVRDSRRALSGRRQILVSIPLQAGPTSWTMDQRQKQQAGLTLMEVLCVMAIIMILAALYLPAIAKAYKRID